MSPGDENPAFLNQQRRMSRSKGLMLDNPDLRAIPRNLRDLRNPVRQLISGSGRAAPSAVTGRLAEPVVPEEIGGLGAPGDPGDRAHRVANPKVCNGTR